MRWSDYSSLGLQSTVSSWSSTSANRSGVLQGNKTAVREADALWTRAASVVLSGYSSAISRRAAVEAKNADTSEL